MSVFPPVRADKSFPALEEEVLARWTRIRAFERSVDQRSADSAYVFYDGPPFATGLPHYGHLVASTLKDIVPRYWAMRGHRVERRFGWDTHGLPIEMEMEKTLGLSGPTSIREYGVGKFNEACRSNVLRYTAEWERVVSRLGRWVDFDNDYKTMDASFMESVWWAFRQLWDKGLVYRDLRVMPYSWRLSTSLSNFEANLDYRDVQDPAITVAVALRDDPDDAHLLIWTTTPWTLPSNLAVAVAEDVTYVRARRAGEDRVFVVAQALLGKVLGEDAEVLGELTGADLVGRTYVPLFPYFERFVADGSAFRVIASEHVTTEDGTGLVHMAPAYGEEDFVACREVGMPVVDPVDAEGRFTDEVTDWAGERVKDADPAIIRDLKERGLLIHHSTIQHSYPFCWRSGTPLIYKTVPIWAVKVTELRDRMVELNREIHWVPDAVGSRRFGNWLADARDWNVSRSRFWGTPLPVWTCDRCDARTCVGSIAELSERAGAEVTDLHPHKIDHLGWACEADGCGGHMSRIDSVFDCWFESGSMPYAQSHYPFEDKDTFEDNFPAQFIAEGLDQTRGWFYTLLVLSTAIFDRIPFRNCIVNGMVLAEDGAKMSKSKRNFPDPSKVLDELGADALRAYLVNSPVVRADPLRFSEAGVKHVVRTVLLPLRNAWGFFVQYANVDGWEPGDGGFQGVPTPAVEDRPELDRWILSVLQSLVGEVNRQMEGYYLYRVVPPMVGFIDDLTNWYIRRSRRRFWRPAETEEARRDKASAYATLYEVLVTFAKVMAPVLPFVTDALYHDLVVTPGQAEGDLDSVHLCDYPEVNEARIDATLERHIAWTRQVVTLGRALRERHQLKTRQPLARVTVVQHDRAFRAAIEEHASLIRQELNVREVVVTADDDDLAEVSFKANYRALGPRVGKRMKEVAGAIGAFDRDAFRRLQDGESVDAAGEPVTLDDIMVKRTPRGDVVIQSDGPVTVALDTTLDDGLRAEGLVREVQRQLQTLRKDSGLAFTDRIRLTVHSDEPALDAALRAHAEGLAEELLAVAMNFETPTGDDVVDLDVDGHALTARIERVTA